MRWFMVGLLGACAPSYDLGVALDRDEVDVGEAVDIAVRGTIVARGHASVELSVAIEDAGPSLDLPEVDFETLGGTPSGAIYILDDRSAAVNESGAVLLRMHDREEEVRVSWRMVCGTAGEWSVWASALFRSAGGAPLTPDERGMQSATLRCRAPE